MKKQKKPLKWFDVDIEFELPTIAVKARTKGEAMKKAMEKLKNTPASRYVCKPKTNINENWRRNQ